MTFSRSYTLCIGVAFILAGVGGFIPLITTQGDTTAPELIFNSNYGYLLGLFPVNLLHNLFHFVAGITAIWMASDDVRAQQYCQIIGIILLVFTIMGSLPELSTALGLMPLFGHDVWLHGLEAGLALYLGFYFDDGYKLQESR